MITNQQLADCFNCSLSRVAKWVDPLNAAMDVFEINTPERQAAFLAQIGHESGRLVYVKELWGPTEAQQNYEGREDLGNNKPGDGSRFRGRGLIQITGRLNYRTAGEALGENLEIDPELLEEPEYAAKSAAWFWQSHGCNELADAGDFRGITRKINGGYNGWEDRLALWNECKKALA